MSIQLKSKAELDIMRRANMVVFEVLSELRQMVVPGVTTKDLDARAKELTAKHGVKAAFLGYPSNTKGVSPFPGVICASRNDEIVHGIPGTEPLEEGDILSIDYGCMCEGFFGDSALTVPVGKITKAAEKLLQVTEQSLEDAIVECKAGARIGDVSYAVQSRVEQNGFSVVREFVGHGIGREMHEPPHVPNFGRPAQGRPLRVGMVLAIEPMVTVGSFETKILSDGWTAVTKDGSLAAHFEHSVAITENGPWVLSRP